MGGIFNIVIGLIMLVGGLSGRLALIGTNNSTILAAIGAAVLAFGVYRTVKDRRRRSD